MDATALVPTASGSRYLQQLCKHWSHKFETQFDGERGRVNFGDTAVHLAAGQEALTLTVYAPDAERLGRMEGVVADHLKRFAFREELAVEWYRG